MALSFVPYEPCHLATVTSWFADETTERWLGDASWPRQLLGAVADDHARDPAIAKRLAYVAYRDELPVGLIDVACLRDGRAWTAIVVGPEYRRQGIARALLESLPELLADEPVDRIVGAVAPGNDASLALAQSLEPDGYERERDGTMVFFVHKR